MYEEVKVLTHSSIQISGEKILYFDPFNVYADIHDADIILITHEHYDHYSPEDIKKVKADHTILICPESMRETLKKSPCGIDQDHTKYIQPGEDISVDHIEIHAVPAYNVGKNFHMEAFHWVGYLVRMAGKSYYIAGDTDINKDVLKVHDLYPDVALVPCGGTFTMDVAEAAHLIREISPKLAIPTHYGSIVGNKSDGDDFVNLLKGEIPAETRINF